MPRATLLPRELIVSLKKYDHSSTAGIYAVRLFILCLLASSRQGGIGRFQGFLYFDATNALFVAVSLGCAPEHGVSLRGAHMGLEEGAVLGARVSHPFGVPLDTDEPALGEVAPLDSFYQPVGRDR